jgi:hypothetical protein
MAGTNQINKKVRNLRKEKRAQRAAFKTRAVTLSSASGLTKTKSDNSTATVKVDVENQRVVTTERRGKNNAVVRARVLKGKKAKKIIKQLQKVCKGRSGGMEE